MVKLAANMRIIPR